MVALTHPQPVVHEETLQSPSAEGGKPSSGVQEWIYTFCGRGLTPISLAISRAEGGSAICTELGGGGGGSSPPKSATVVLQGTL